MVRWRDGEMARWERWILRQAKWAGSGENNEIT